ncbi:MAG: hypothetical protein B0A82_01745 [Alkalinema sp. CACIAM 70d]|uniref:hypothetical protein n=1 Tax=Alkalinema sp. FACHB-956 TaxID=2692768 RepID=UPI000B7022D2|nr:hypothetical protein [Alkalinema sp. FACHB-956]MBD2328087.1 hypothetical protein [Alkalinema sp. FACHB-956]OUC16430.1 MAG: hypothetical protein B0A82_01745 [Alkalinema sp. CACIAM 70d]
MGSNRIGQLAWAALGLIGLISIVDIDGIPIVICPQCGRFNPLLGVLLVALAVAAFVSNRKAIAETGTIAKPE